jgi:hypothetical protein
MNTMNKPAIIEHQHKRNRRITLLDVGAILTSLTQLVNEYNHYHYQDKRFEYIYPEDANYFFEYVVFHHLKVMYPSIKIANMRGSIDVYKTFVDYIRLDIKSSIMEYLATHLHYGINLHSTYHILIIGSDLYLLEQMQ